MKTQSKKSEILEELERNYKDIKILIGQQMFKVVDAEYYLERYYNVIRHCESLVKSRDNWRMKYEMLLEKKNMETPKNNIQNSEEPLEVKKVTKRSDGVLYIILPRNSGFKPNERVIIRRFHHTYNMPFVIPSEIRPIKKGRSGVS